MRQISLRIGWFLCGQDLTASPSIDDIVHYDSWARDWTAEHATSFQAKKQVVLQ